MRLAVWQDVSPGGDIAAGLAAVDRAAATAATAGADILTLPELFLPGYVATGRTAPQGWSTVFDHLTGIARRHAVGLCIGLPDYVDGQAYNAAVFLDPGGVQRAIYHKIQLFGPDEQAVFQPGSQHVVFDFGGVRIAVLICYDVEFSEHVRALARAGVQVLLVPTANMAPFENVNQFLVPARAAENAITIAYANYCGREGHLEYVGQSRICGPDGYPLARAGDAPEMLIADVPNGPAGIPLSTQLADLRQVPDP